MMHSNIQQTRVKKRKYILPLGGFPLLMNFSFQVALNSKDVWKITGPLNTKIIKGNFIISKID